jgi:predicted nucleotidyltransferase component of viral defense system
MIPRRHIISWRQSVPWADDGQVEQDLVLSRALVELFRQADVGSQLVMRGGTALNKLILPEPARYSEDLDLVMRTEGIVGPITDAVRSTLDPWLGIPRRDRSRESLTITYRFESSVPPVRSLRLKVEINTADHLALLPIGRSPFEVDSPWFQGVAHVPVYDSDELFGTKLRALYQRRKGRDLFDLWLALTRDLINPSTVVQCFQRYMEYRGTPVSRAQFEANLLTKSRKRGFHHDVLPLLSPEISYDSEKALGLVMNELIARLPGESWKGQE